MRRNIAAHAIRNSTGRVPSNASRTSSTIWPLLISTTQTNARAFGKALEIGDGKGIQSDRPQHANIDALGASLRRYSFQNAPDNAVSDQHNVGVFGLPLFGACFELLGTGGTSASSALTCASRSSKSMIQRGNQIGARFAVPVTAHFGVCGSIASSANSTGSIIWPMNPSASRTTGLR